MRTGGRSPPSLSLRFGTAICGAAASGIRQTLFSLSVAADVAATNRSSTDGARLAGIVASHAPATRATDVVIRRMAWEPRGRRKRYHRSSVTFINSDAECAIPFGLSQG